MTTFLEALKAQSATQSANQFTPTRPTAASQSPIPPAPKSVTVQPSQSAGRIPAVRVEVVLNKNRIDLFFAAKPMADTLEALKRNGFWYRPSDKAWFNKDNDDTRATIRRMFDVYLPDLDMPASPVSTVAVSPRLEAPTGTSDQPVSESPSQNDYNDSPSPEWNTFKRQVDDLLAHHKVSAGDLMVLAIDCFHKKTFGGNN